MNEALANPMKQHAVAHLDGAVGLGGLVGFGHGGEVTCFSAEALSQTTVGEQEAVETREQFQP